MLPITSLGLEHEAPAERVSTGVPRLDTMLGGEGVYRGSSVLISGTAGTGKTSLAAHFADRCAVSSLLSLDSMDWKQNDRLGRLS